MAFVISTWDSPVPDKEVRERWIRTILAAPGTVSWQVLSNPVPMTPQTMSLHKFDSLEAAQNWVASPERAALIAETRQAGLTSLTVQVWDTNPYDPEPLKP